MKKMAAFCLLAGLSLLAEAQVSTLVESGKDGVLIAPTLEFEKGYSAYGAIIGFSVDGSIDVQGDFLFSNYNEDYDLENEASSTGFTVSIEWWAIRNELSPSMDLNLGIKAALDNYAFKDYKFISSIDTSNFDEYYSVFGGNLGADAQLTYRFADTWMLHPALLVGIGIGSRNEMVDGTDQVGTYVGLNGNASLLLGKQIYAGSLLFLKVGRSFNTYDMPSAFRVNVGYVLAL